MTDIDSHVATTQKSRRWPTVTAFVVAELVTFGLLFGPVASQGWWGGFRGYFANDQMSYAAIATNVSTGNLALVEPFTLTGNLFYPSAWYQLMGLVGWATGAPIWVLWQVLGALVVLGALAVVGWTALRLSGRWWAPLLPGAALFTGTLALRTSGDWLTLLGHHAVLWGPFGTLFTLNAEAIGVSTAAIALCLLMLAARGPHRWLVIVSAGLIGLLANVQTYSFLASAFLTALIVASASVLINRARVLGLISALLLIAVIAFGPAIASSIGPLPLFGVLLAALAPAMWPLAIAHLRLTIASLVALGLLAAPQVLRTLAGVASKDPFLLYRQESTTDLGVPIGPAILAALPLILIGVACAIVVWRKRQHVLASILIALPIAMLVMSTNDRWGFNQEPYRFWLQYEILGALLLSVILAWSIANLSKLARPRRVAAVIALIVAAAVWTVSAWDVTAWWRFAAAQGVLSTTDARADALREILRDREGLVMSSQCFDPRLLKLIDKGPVAFYNAGLAWPADEQAFKIFQDPSRRAGEDFYALTAANITWVVTDSACTTDWQFGPNQMVLPVATESYLLDDQPQQLQLWKVQGF